MAGLLPILLLFPLMYFMLIRPQQKRVREQQALLAAVGEGDEIVTTAGLYGYVTAVDGDVLWVEISDGVEVRLARAAVAKRIPAEASTASDDGAQADGAQAEVAKAEDATGHRAGDSSGDETR